MKLFASLLAIAATVAASAANPIPVDPAVRTGTLPNGLTYYIRHNATPAGQADFFIAQRVGSVNELEGQEGLAHFLEHMCFNGTEHFPGNSLISYLESLGVKFGRNLNAYTSTDETVYNICEVPTARQSALDSCVMILGDWSGRLLLTDKDIDAERGVIRGEMRQRSTPGSPLVRPFYRLYTRHVIPTVGRMVSKDVRAYSYLPESIAAVPQGQAMVRLLEQAGFSSARVISLCFGACSIYTAEKA